MIVKCDYCATKQRTGRLAGWQEIPEYWDHPAVNKTTIHGVFCPDCTDVILHCSSGNQNAERYEEFTKILMYFKLKEKQDEEEEGAV